MRGTFTQEIFGTLPTCIFYMSQLSLRRGVYGMRDTAAVGHMGY